jgi:hypothetical protein
MVRVPLPFRGVAVLLLAASTVVGQTPEPPAELLPLDSVAPTTPNFLREFSADPRHPLLALMVDGELSSLEPAQAQDSSKIKPQAKSSSAAPKTDTSEGVIVDDGQFGGQLGGQLGGGQLGGGQLSGGLLGDGQCDGGLLGGGFGGGMCGGCGQETMGPMAPNMLPFACAPPPCCCRKCQRRCGHKHCGGCGSGGGCGNAYLNWPSCPPCFYCSPCNAGCHKHRCGRRHCGGCGNYGYGGGWDMGCDGWGMDCGCWMPAPSCGHKCHRRHKHCGGYPCCGGYGGGGWDMGCGGGWDMGYGGGWGMDCGCWMPPPCSGHKCHRRHGCSNCCYGGYGYSGWDGCGYGYGCGCGRHHRSRCHRGCQQLCCYPMMTPCMGMSSGMGMCSGMGMMSGMGCESFGSGGMLAGDCGCDGTLGGMGY